MKVPFSKIFEDCTSLGTKIKTDEYCSTGKYAIIDQGQNNIAGYTDRTDGVYYDVPAIIFGDHTRAIKYVDTPFFLGADGAKLLKSKAADANYKYLYYALQSVRIPDTGYNRHFKWLKESEFEYPDLDKQSNIATVLDKVTDLITKSKRQLELLDELVKARFVEMFGRIENNSNEYCIKPMTSICEIIDGDRGKNYPKQEEFYKKEFCLFLNAKNVTKTGFCFKDCMFISKDKDSALNKGKLKRGDIVLTTRGTIGNIALYDNSVPFTNIRINSGMAIIRIDRNILVDRFFIEHFKQQLTEIKAHIANGSAQPQLPISTMRNIKLLIPSIKLQQDFSTFVVQTDKSKALIAKSLEQFETLKKALMQKYFG